MKGCRATSTQPAWSTRGQARPAPRGSARRGTRRGGRRGRRWTARATRSSGLLDSRQPSQTEVPMRRIGLAVAPLVAEAQQRHIPRVGVVAAQTREVAIQYDSAFRDGLRNAGYVEG